LLHAVSFFYATYLTFPKHVDALKSPARVRHAVSNEKKPIPSFTSRFMRAMVLLDEVVEILPMPQFTGIWHGPSAFSSLSRSWIGRVFINGDDSRSAGMRRSKRFSEEAFGRVMHFWWD
jgi:hypothetical protein